MNLSHLRTGSPRCLYPVFDALDDWAAYRSRRGEPQHCPLHEHALALRFAEKLTQVPAPFTATARECFTAVRSNDAILELFEQAGLHVEKKGHSP